MSPSAIPPVSEPAVRPWLETAAAWRFFSLSFRLPTPQACADLVAIAAELPEEVRDLAGCLRQAGLGDWEREFHRVLGAGGVPACASSYDDNALAGRGPMLADMRGFYEAFAYRPRELPAEVPDHLAVALDFLSYLAMKIAFALHEAGEEEVRITREAYDRFLDEHLRTWLARFCARLEGAGSPVYARLAEALLERVGPSAEPTPGPGSGVGL